MPNPVQLDFSKAQPIAPQSGVSLDFSKAQAIPGAQPQPTTTVNQDMLAGMTGMPSPSWTPQQAFDAQRGRVAGSLSAAATIPAVVGASYPGFLALAGKELAKNAVGNIAKGAGAGGMYYLLRKLLGGNQNQ